MRELKGAYDWINKNPVVSMIVLILILSFSVTQFFNIVKIEPKQEVVSGELKVELDKLDNNISDKLVPKVLDINTSKTSSCSPQQAKIVLSDSQLAKTMNLLVIDLNNFNLKTVKEVTGYFTKEQLVCVKRDLIPSSKGTTQYYISICEPKDKLNYNKMAFGNKEKFIVVKKKE